MLIEMLILTQKLLLTFLLSFGIAGYSMAAAKPVAARATENTKVAPTRSSSFQQLKTNLSRKIKGINQSALDAGLKAYLCATNVRNNVTKRYLTIIDYSKPSSQKRMYIIDMQKQKLVSSQLVAHGQNTGGRDAANFSNKDGSHQSSLGVFVTGREYSGKHGLSLRLQGLEPGYNDKAGRRAIVMHGANYVNQQYVKKYGMIGRSWGCMAIENSAVSSTIKAIKDGSVVVAYYKDNQWLKRSNYLHCKAVA